VLGRASRAGRRPNVGESVGCGDEDRWPRGVVNSDGDHYQYVLSEMLIAATTPEVDYYSLDIDCDDHRRRRSAANSRLAVRPRRRRRFTASLPASCAILKIRRKKVRSRRAQWLTATAASVVAVSLGSCCPREPDKLSRTSSPSISGQLYSSFGNCGETWCPTVEKAAGLVRIFEAPACDLVEEVWTDDGAFDISLAPGEYEVELGILKADLDDSLGRVSVEPGRGYRIVRTYEVQFDDTTLMVWFTPSVENARMIAIIEESSLVFERFLGGGGAVLCSVPHGTHVLEAGDALLVAYPDEVEAYMPNFIECGG